MKSFICPVCNRDLASAMRVLEDPIGVFKMHMRMHESQWQRDISASLQYQWSRLPATIRKCESDRLKGLSLLLGAERQLKVKIENGEIE